MSGIAAAALGFGVMLLLIALRMPVGLSMLVVGSIGYVHLSSWAAFLAYMKTNPYYQFANYTLSVIPLFILMGALAERAGISTSLFRAAEAFAGRFMRGGLAMAVIWACTAFGAICGSSVATTATFGRAALPELQRYKYDGGFATGTIAVGGTLGILIPPSIILVVYAITTEQNIAKLFMAALIPGLLAALFYTLAIALTVRRRPELAPPVAIDVADRGKSALSVWPVLLIAVVVIGGIYGGVFTPTEGAAFGAVSMLLVGLAQRTLNWSGIVESLKQTAETSAMIFIILLGSEVFDAFLALSRLPESAAAFVGQSGLPPYAIMITLMLFYILLGAVMDELAMLLLTLPVFFPIVQALDFGMPADEVAIWFGILVLIVVGIGLTAPPIGLNVFVISSIAKTVPIASIYRGVLPFIGMDIIRLGARRRVSRAWHSGSYAC